MLNGNYYSQGYSEQDPYQMQQQQQLPLSQDEMYAHMIKEDRIKNVLAQISPDNQLYEIEMRIKGYKKNVQNNTWEKISEDIPEPSSLLVGRFISFLSSILNQNTSLSNLSENQVNKIMKLCIEYVTDDLDANAEEYGLGSNYTERTRIGLIVLNSIFFVLNRALNGQEARRMWGAMSLNENINAPTKKGPLDFLKWWK